MKSVRDSYPVHGDLGLASLSFASGCTDVLTFLKLGNVFTSAMTGNTALLAIELGRGNTVAASRALTAQDTHKPLRLWFQAMWYVVNQKNGVSALGLLSRLVLRWPPN